MSFAGNAVGSSRGRRPPDGADESDARAAAVGPAHGADNPCLAAALDYLRRGWPVLALCPADHRGMPASHLKTCQSPGKAVWHAWKAFQTRLPTAEEVTSWWREHPASNVGLALGRMVRVDVDGPAGERRLAELSGGDLPVTLEFTRGAGGSRGLLYLLPAGSTYRTAIDTQGGDHQELRLQALGAQTVLPPSRHHAGDLYAWKPGRGPGEVEPAPAPAWLIARLEALQRNSASTSTAARGAADNDGQPIPDGARNSTLASLAGSMRRRGMTEAEILAALRQVNADRCRPALDDGEVVKIAKSISGYEPGNDAAAGGTAGTKDGRTLDVRRMSEFRPEPVVFLVEGYLPLGKVMLIAGPGGLGKSAVTLDVAACVTTGRCAFGLGYAPPPPADVLLFSAEDDPDDTISPRLAAAGADLARVGYVAGTRDKDGKPLPFSLNDCDVVARHLHENPGVKLVILDPVSVFVGRTGADSHKESDVQAILATLRELAMTYKVAIVLVAHLNKSIDQKARNRVSGSVAFVNGVRAAFVVIADEADDGRRMILKIKFNAGIEPPGLVYRMRALTAAEADAVRPRLDHLDDVRREALLGQLFRISWEGTTSEKADEVMSRRQGPPKDADRAAEWLREHLEPGPAPSDTCAARGNEALNMSHRKDWWRDVVLKSMLGGKVRKRGFGDSQWYFTLPSHPWPFPGPGEEPPKEPVTTPAASSASSGPSAALVVYVPPPTEEAEEPEEPEEAESRRVGSVRGPSADLAGEPAEEPSKESPRTSSDSSGSSGSSASFAVDTQPRPTPSSEEPEEAEGGEEAGGESHRYGPDVSAADDEVVLDLGEIEHVDR